MRAKGRTTKPATNNNTECEKITKKKTTILKPTSRATDFFFNDFFNQNPPIWVHTRVKSETAKLQRTVGGEIQGASVHRSPRGHRKHGFLFSALQTGQTSSTAILAMLKG